MGLLFLNSLKGLTKHKLQMVAIILLIFLSTGIYTTMNQAIDRIENRYYDYLDEQNVEDFAFVLNVDYEKEFSKEQVLSYLDNELKNINDEDKNMVYLYSSCLDKTKPSYCNEYLYYNVDLIFEDNDIIKKIGEEKLDKIKEEYNFSYELQESKMLKDEDKVVLIMAYNNDARINVPYLVEGKFPTKDNEITILKGFANKNNIKIGDSYKINDKDYEVVGYTYASAYIYPLISISTPMFDESKNNIVFTTINAYEKINGIEEKIYAGKFNNKTDPRNRMEIDIIEDEEGNLIPKSNNPATDIFIKEQDIITRDMNTIFRTIRIDSMQQEIKTNRTFASYFLYLLLTISIVIIIIINKKRIEDERLQIGVLKSLGYKKASIAVSYLTYPIIGSLIGGIFGYTIGYLLNGYLANYYLSYFNIVLEENMINYHYLLQSIFIPMVSLSILTFIISIFMLRKKPLELLKEGSNLKVNFLTKITNFITKKMNFEKKFKYSLASRSISKLLIISITSFLTGLLITLILIGSSLFDNLINDSFGSLKFNYMVSYSSVKEYYPNKEDLLLQVSTSALKVIDKNDKIREIEEELTINLTGIDSKLNYLDIYDKDNNNLLDNLTDKTIIINENVKKLLDVEVGDYLVLSLNGEEYSYEIVGVHNSYMGNTCYTKRNRLSEDLGFDKDIYNLKYTNDNSYKNLSKLDEDELNSIAMVLSFDELKDNMEDALSVYNSSVYIIIIFAAIMVLVIILVIANVIVEENKKTISLMKVMGYKDKKISKIVLNIYTPFIVIFYLLSVPCMINILKTIVDVVAKDIDMAIPITINLYQVLLGLTSLLCSYFIAIAIAKKTLNKVPLSIALKRE